MGIPPDAIIARIVVYSHESEKRSTVDATVSEKPEEIFSTLVANRALSLL